MAHCRKTQLTVFLTERCNLRCRYCYVDRKQASTVRTARINPRFVRRGISDFFRDYPSREIRFFGIGEPTLEFSLMCEIRDWAYEQSRGDCRFELQTNGFFSIQVAEWVGCNIDIIWISCDGPPAVQNYYRPTPGGRLSSDIVEKNIRYLSSRPVVLGCRATIGARNVRFQSEMIDYFSGLGVRVVMSDPMFAPVGVHSQDTASRGAPDLMEYADHFLIAREYAQEQGIFYGSMLTVNFDEPTEYACRACIPYPHLTIDGYVSACDMAYAGDNRAMSDLVYGHYLPEEDMIEYDHVKIEQIRSRKGSNMPRCRGCEVLANCAGACLGEALNETESIFGIKPEVCKAIRYLAKRMPLNEGLYPYLHP